MYGLFFRRNEAVVSKNEHDTGKLHLMCSPRGKRKKLFVLEVGRVYLIYRKMI
jgi:hypothetical protein